MTIGIDGGKAAAFYGGGDEDTMGFNPDFRDIPEKRISYRTELTPRSQWNPSLSAQDKFTA